MSGIPRLRTKYDYDPSCGKSPFSGFTKVQLGKYYLEQSPGHWVHGFAVDPYQDVPQTASMSGACCRDEIHPGPPYTEGGPFSKVSVELPELRVQGMGSYESLSTNLISYFGYGNGRARYEGGFAPLNLLSGLNIPSLVTGETLIPDTTAWELQAYKKTRPKLESASAFVFVAEMRDIPRMLRSSGKFFHDVWKDVYESNIPFRNRRTMHIMQPKKIADDFLNHQFGWTPFIGDLRKFYSTFHKAAAMKARLRANNDKWITRRATLADETTEELVSSGTGMEVEPLGEIIGKLFTTGSSPRWEIWDEKHSVVTAVGNYKYYRPEFDANLPDYNSAWNTIQREITLYGARISPSNVYRAVPWTWLIDWCADIGGVIDAMDDIAIDALAARYLYVMRHEYTVRKFTQLLPFVDGTLSLTWDLKTDAKVRKPASTPYGFGLSWNLLSPRQLAILASLGITRMR